MNDIIITESYSDSITDQIATLRSKFAIKDLDPLNFFLGIEVSTTSHDLHLSQAQYIRDVLSRANMLSTNPCPSPMVSNAPFSKFDGDPIEEPRLYLTIIGALQYATITRPDIAFAVNKISQFMHKPTSFH